jgi:hypothetical protein
LKTRFEKIVEALREKEKQINEELNQDIAIKIRDGNILVCSDNVLWKPKNK